MADGAGAGAGAIDGAGDGFWARLPALMRLNELQSGFQLSSINQINQGINCLPFECPPVRRLPPVGCLCFSRLVKGDGNFR